MTSRTTRPLIRHWVAVLIAVIAVLGMSACTGDEQPTDGRSAPDLLSDAEQKLKDAGTVKISLSSEGVPDGTNGVTAAEGSGVIDAQTPKFGGTFTGTVSGINGTIDVIAIGDQVWMKLFTPNYVSIGPADLGAPNPAMLFHPDTGLVSLLADTTDPQIGESVREGSDVLTTVTGSVPAKTVNDLLNIGKDSGEYQVEYGITESSEVRTVRIDGEFYGSQSSTYQVTLTDYGAEVDINEP